MVHYEYDGKVALVTGASSGIGKATAIAFGAAGAKVVVAARREAESEAVAETIRSAGGEALFVQTDVSEPDQVEAMVAKTVDKFGRLDFAFNNAGGGGLPGLRMHEVSVEDWDRQTHVYLRSVFLSMKFEVTQMLEQDGGTIVNNASVLGLVGNVGSCAHIWRGWHPGECCLSGVDPHGDDGNLERRSRHIVSSARETGNEEAR